MRHAFTRYGINGLVFSLLGPALFWMLYPLGAMPAWLLAEASCQLLRFASFHSLIFPRRLGYHVSILRYLTAIMPTSLTGLMVVAILQNHLNRTELTLTGATITTTIGFLVSHSIFRRPTGKHPQPR